MDETNKLCAEDYFDLLYEIAEIRHSILIRANIRDIPMEELVNEGYFGLVKAVERFDPEKGKDFSKFASYYINNAISTFLRNEDVIDHRLREELKKMKEVIRALQQRLGREPTDREISDKMKIEAIRALQQQLDREPTEQEIADKIKIDETRIRELKSFNILKVSIDETSDDEGTVSREIAIEYQKHEKMDKIKLGADVDECIKSTLSKDEMLILLLKEFRNFTFKSIVEIMGKNYNLTGVHRINERAKRLLKECLENKDWKITDMIAIFEDE